MAEDTSACGDGLAPSQHRLDSGHSEELSLEDGGGHELLDDPPLFGRGATSHDNIDQHRPGKTGWEVPERRSGPHLRAVVIIASALFWLATRTWAPQLSMLPFAMFCTTTSSALWCTAEGLVISLGPVPVCVFRRRIPYRDIASVTVVRGRWAVLDTLLRRGIRLWQPLGFAYGLTLGKALVDISLQPAEDSGSPAPEEEPRTFWSRFSARLGCQGCCSVSPLLISVDEAEDIVAHIRFRCQHGVSAPLPHSLIPAAEEKAQAKWVVCDVFELLLSWHARNRVACDVFALLFQPFQPEDQSYAWAAHARSA
mmetsp:Transcript_87512/g.155218  ORF Transcript_87512/g.155218 Transcript_87512/m.155218 type:complete len:311 (+) Transcript_87512:37-969(+)